VSFGVWVELGIEDPWAGGVMVAAGRVGNILVVGDRTSGGGEGCSIGFSGLV